MSDPHIFRWNFFAQKKLSFSKEVNINSERVARFEVSQCYCLNPNEMNGCTSNVKEITLIVYWAKILKRYFSKLVKFGQFPPGVKLIDSFRFLCLVEVILSSRFRNLKPLQGNLWSKLIKWVCLHKFHWIDFRWNSFLRQSGYSVVEGWQQAKATPEL